uniref:Uncharacterized protein n=1 Tax=Podoviridae sp. ctG4L18 TaxID=2825234 RepID=A0A8S5UP20_9CAUD|nr:MAG TPA: hypothetical protein [Podoviridae sp. ctG4L18]
MSISRRNYIRERISAISIICRIVCIYSQIPSYSSNSFRRMS